MFITGGPPGVGKSRSTVALAEAAQADDSKIVAAIVTAKSHVLASGRAARELIGSVVFQRMQTRRLNATALLAEHFEVRKIQLRLSELANAAKGVVELREIEDLLTRPLRNQAEELGALFVLKVKFAPIREACLERRESFARTSNRGRARSRTRRRT